jgi:hypothetical protein
VLLRPRDLAVQLTDAANERVENQLLVAALHKRRPGRGCS